jgi:superfamily II DNA or RNA helicase
MAESALQESTSEQHESEPKPPIADFVGKMSDRAIQRVTGGNAFLRGRLYARRKAVDSLDAHGREVSGQILVRSATEPYKTEVSLGEDSRFTSSCTCPGWRGPTGHCKHVAAVLVALRDRERPPKPKGEEAPSQAEANGHPSSAPPPKKKKAAKEKSEPVHVPGTVSVGGKRRRSRRRRRGAEAGPLELLKPVELRDTLSSESRGVLDAWFPAEALARPQEFEYRVTVRSASITVTPVIAGTRHAVPVEAALSGFSMIPASDRGLFRALSRHINRGQPATAELRGEDAAEIVGLLRNRRVLLEPASMELRITDEPLRPRIELDRASPGSLRVRVVFALESNNRRFSLSNGAWFEGTPGYHIDTTEGVARPVLESVTPAWLTRLYRSPALVLPDSELPVLLTDFIPKVANSLGADLPELESIADVVDAQPRFELRGDGDIVSASVKLRALYDDEDFQVPTAGIAPPLAFLPARTPGGRPRVVRRDVGEEMAAVQRLLSLGLVPGESREDVVGSGEAAIEFWTNGIASLPAEWAKFVPDDLAQVKIRKETVTPQLRVASGVDWLSLDMTFAVGSAVVAEDELRACLAHGRRIVKLSDGTYAPVDPENVGEILERMAEIYATSGGGGKKLPLSQAGRINDLLQVVGRATVTTAAKSLFEKLDQVGEIPNVAKPRALKATLRPYQKEGYNWLAFLHNLASGGILADDMGLGKTLQTIALLAWAKGKEKQKLNLVVAPTSVVPNWAREIEKFAPTLKTVIWQGADRAKLRDELDDADVMITSYALLRRDEELLEELDFRYVILDEAQHIKNPMSHTARAAKRLASERRLALTGTPIENRLSEIWSIFDFVSPGLLGDLKTFEEKMARPIDRGDEETTARLRATIRPFVLRRLKADVAADLPEKIEQEIIVPLEDDQSTLYKQILGEVRKSVLSEIDKQGVAKAQIQILAALTRLRQVACDPRLMKLEGRQFGPEDSGKLGALREIVGEAVSGGHRVLIFSQFVEMLHHIRDALDADGVKYEYLDGSTKDRIERVDRFNAEDGVPVFLISLKAGGTGLNLTGADTVIHFDPWWNPAVEDQATDRAHRIGQTKVVTVYRLIARGTVEEKILQLSGKKRQLVSSVLSAEGAPVKGLTKDDVDELFSE